MEAIINIAKVGKCRIQEDQESWEWSQRFSFICSDTTNRVWLELNPTWKEKESTITKMQEHK